MEAADEITGIFKKKVTPKNTYVVYDCKIDNASVTLNEITIYSVSLAKHLEGCHRAVLLAATLGTNADVLINKYSIQDMGKALIAQKVCTAMIEAYLDETEKRIMQISELKELSSVTRYSPGYGDFDIACQKDILRLLNASRIGLSLTEGFMLVPSKSVTAVIGLKKNEEKTAAGNAVPVKCAFCEYKNCGFREKI
ncbi:MAG: hypothetical protein FWB89_01935 [Treponema sp.]|nr:hypothetical protein [Treponema sp.]